VFGYALFTWSIIRLIPPHQPEPDLLVCALLYSIFAMLFRIRRGTMSWEGSIFFGALLGLGYLCKGIMFPMGFVFCGIALFLAGWATNNRYKMVVAFSVFLLLSLPYVVALSNHYGRWTFYDGGWINYAVEISGVKPWVHWQGEEPGQGTPVHPTRKIYNNPPMYEFGTPFKVTYPPWYDPSYWYQGVKLIPDLRQQLRVIKKNVRVLVFFLAESTGSGAERLPTWGNLEGKVRLAIGPLLTLFCVLLLINIGGVSGSRRAAEYWFVLVPVCAVLVMYGLLHYQGRYIAAYIVVLWMVLFGSVAITYSEESKKIVTAVLFFGALITTILLAIGTGEGFLRASREYLRGDPEAPFFQSGYPNWKVATYLKDKGVQPGDAVGAVGYTLSGYWARMARVRVIAEVPAEGSMEFWSMDTASKAMVMKIFRDVGAQAVVAKVGFINAQHEHEWDLQGTPGEVWPLPVSAADSTRSGGSAPTGWKRIAGTDYYVYVF